MTPERWQQVTGLFHAALAHDTTARAAFVAAQCGDDVALRREVEAMLAAHERPGLLSRTDAGATPTFTAGDRLGPYEILARIGAGGMGEVFRGRDPRLQRDVALKVLLPSVAADPDRVVRFATEARLLASLNHPHIAQVYGLEEAPPSAAGHPALRALVMELVEGPTLAERLAPGRALPVAEALAIARQVAEALEAAHEQGIIHRDLKPANIKVRPDGTVKVLDFGLAKLRLAPLDAPDPAGATVAAPLTEPGLIVGTAAYMAPEQAKGAPVDRRADLWAFGCVLFEMLTGRRVFDDASLPATLLKVVSHEPDWPALPATTPPAIRTLLRRCLEKDPRRRLDSAAAARLDIDDALTTCAERAGSHPHSNDAMPALPSQPVAPPQRSWSTRQARRLVSAIATAAALTAGVTWFFTGRERTPATKIVRLQNALQVTNALGVETNPTWSPDGTRIAYHASDGGYGEERPHDVFVSQLGRSDPIRLTSAEGDNRSPSWSPDGGELAFFSNRTGIWALYTMPAIGGRPRQVLPLPDMTPGNWSAPQWSSDGQQLHVSANVHSRNVVLVLSLSSLQTSRIEMPDHDGNVIWDLNLSPDGRRYAYVSGGGGQTEVTQLWTIASSGGEPVPLTDGYTNVWSPTWSRNGRHVYYVSNRGGAMDLWRQTVESDGKPVGEPTAITQGVGLRAAAFSPDGKRIAYSRGAWVSNVWRVPILADRPATWSDATAITSERAFVEFVDVSPDGSQLAISSDRRGNQDLWILPSAGGEMTPLTTDPSPDWNPRWSPDGQQMVFFSNRSGNRDIWVMPAAGGPARQLTSTPGRDSEPSWSPNGRDILFRSRPQSAWIVSASGGAPRLVAEGFGPDPVWSPDGLWVLLRRNGALYRVPSAGGDATPLTPTPPSPRPGSTVRFSRDGRHLYYVESGPTADQNIWRLSFADGKISPLTRLAGRRGVLNYYFAADARFLYFTWREDDGDIWVMDAANLGEGD